LEWGSVLDAGTGEHSLSWIVGLNSTKYAAVTGEIRKQKILLNGARNANVLRRDDEILFGNWLDPMFLKGKLFC
jgi:hypothetical protein